MPVKRSKLVTRLMRLPALGPVVKKIHDPVLRVRYRINRDHVLNPRSRSLFERTRTPLSAVQERLVNELKTNGIAMVDCGELFGNHDLWEEIRGYAEAFADSSERTPQVESSDADYGPMPAKGTPSLRRHFTEDECISWSNPMLRMGIETKVLDVVNAYLGLWAKLKKVHLWHTTPSKSHVSRTGSQVWHRDPEDEKMVTVFLYFTDVDGGAGPLQYIPGTRYDGQYRDLWPNFGGSVATSKVTEEEIAKSIPIDGVHTATCRRGTFLFCDTSGFHRGGFATNKSRLVAHWTYASPASLWPKRFSVAEDLREIQLAPASSFALL
jgi:hypothetical protein